MRTQAGKEVHCAALCACEGDWSSVNAPIWTPHSCLSVFFFSFLFANLSRRPGPLRFPQPHVHSTAEPDQSSRLADTTAGVHWTVPACGATSFGNRFRLDFIFGSQCFSEVGFGAKLFFPSSLYRWSNEGYRLENDFCFCFFEEDGNLDLSLRRQTTSRKAFRHFRKVFWH